MRPVRLYPVLGHGVAPVLDAYGEGEWSFASADGVGE